jgi:hypothetical protein
MSLGNMLSLLTQNPGVAVFGMTSSDYPNGITRTALLAAFKIAIQNNALYDTLTGKWNSQVYGPGLVVSGGTVNGGLQDKETYQPNPNGVGAASLPVSSPSQVSSSAVPVNGNTNTGTIGGTTGEFSPPGDCGAVATAAIVSGPPSIGVAFAGPAGLVNTPTQVQ